MAEKMAGNTKQIKNISQVEPKKGGDINDNKKSEKKLRKRNRILQSGIEIFSIFFWVYVLTKVFLFDLDLYLIQNHFPTAGWAVKYKFLFLLGTISFIWIFTRNISLLQSVLYILFYPVIFCVWKVPKTLVKRQSWVGAFALIGLLLSFFRNLKFNIIMAFIGLTSLCIILNLQNSIALYASCIFIFSVLFVYYVKSLYVSIRPSILFQMQSQVINKILERAKKTFVPSDELKDLSIQKMSESQLQTWSMNLQFAIIFNQTCYFLTTKLQDFQKSRVNILYYIFNFLILVVTTVVVYAAIFYGIYKIDPSQFTVPYSPKFVHFIYYSTNALCTANIPDFVATSTLARLVTTAETVSGVFLLVILFFLVTTIQTDRHAEELKEVVRSIRDQGKKLESLIQEEYRMTIKEAIIELEKIKASLIKVIYFLSESIAIDHVNDVSSSNNTDNDNNQ